MLPLKLIQLNKHKQMIRNCEHIDLSTECRIVPCWRERVTFQSVIGMKKIFMPFQFEIIWNGEGGGVEAITEQVHNCSTKSTYHS